MLYLVDTFHWYPHGIVSFTLNELIYMLDNKEFQVIKIIGGNSLTLDGSFPDRG